MDIIGYLTEATKEGASDVFIVVGRPLSVKINGVLKEITDTPLKPADAEALIEKLFPIELQGSPKIG